MQNMEKALKNKKILTLLGIAGGLILLITVFITLQRKNESAQRISDASQSRLYFMPVSGTQLSFTQPTNIDVMMDTRGQNVTGARVEIQYDNSKLRLNSVDKTNSVFGSDNVEINQNFAANKAVIVADKSEDNPVTGDAKKIATLQFSPLGTGSARLEFVGNNIVETVVNGQSTNLTIEAPSAEYSIGVTSTSPPVTSTVTTIPSITSVLSPSLTSTPQNCLPYGDVDGNGSITQADLNLVTAYMNNGGTLSVGQFSRADVTRDTLVNVGDSNAISLLVQGNWVGVFPGNPLLCPQLLPFHIGFKEKNTTLNVNNPNPTKNTIVISNPYKLPVKSVSFRGAYNSAAIRVTGVDALQGSFAAGFPDISQNDFKATIELEPTITAQEFEIATVDVIPYIPGGANGASITFNSATFNVVVNRVGNETVPGSIAVDAGKANYTVNRGGTSAVSTTQSPTNGNQPTGNPFATSTLIPTINASPPPGGASVRISVTLPAIGTNFASDNKTPAEPNRQVQIQLTKSESTTPITATGMLAFNGNEYVGYVVVPSATAGNYQIKARLNNTLYKVIPGIYALQDASSVNTTTVALNSGDVNQDNKIDLYDYNSMIGCIQQKPSCTQILKALTDLNSNRVTNAADYNIFITQLRFREGD